MHDTLEARNELEEKLLVARGGLLPGDKFLQYLIDTRVFMPVKDPIGIAGFTASDEALPLTVKTGDCAGILVLFTSPECAKSFLEEYPDIDSGLLAEFRWVLERTGSGAGISIKPNWPVGMDLEPEMVRQLKHN